MARRHDFRPQLMSLLALVVLIQSGVLFWIMIHPDTRDDMLAGMRDTPVVGEVVEICLPANPQV
ncbi:MAG: hypothetical protein Q8M05_03890 [Rhodoferax sp.]|nr:hypothetical protein [Rhodoferax sp.]